MGENESGIGNLVFGGKITNLAQLSQYLLLGETDYHSMAPAVWKDEKGLAFLISHKEDELLLILDTSRQGAKAPITYAYAEGLGSHQEKNEDRQIAANRIAVASKLQKIVLSGQATVEAYASIPDDLEGVVPLGGLDYERLFLNISRQHDESQKEKGKVVEAQAPERPAERKFFGFDDGIYRVGSFINLATNAYQKYDRFALVFSSRNKQPLYLYLENHDQQDRIGPYMVACVYYPDKRLQAAVKKREAAIKSDPESYLIGRMTARSSSGLKIEGFCNPPKPSLVIDFENPIHIKQFIVDLAKKLDSSSQTHDLLEEDQDTFVEQSASQQPVPLGKEFEKEGESKVEAFFNEDKKPDEQGKDNKPDEQGKDNKPDKNP